MRRRDILAAIIVVVAVSLTLVHRASRFEAFEGEEDPELRGYVEPPVVTGLGRLSFVKQSDDGPIARGAFGPLRSANGFIVHREGILKPPFRKPSSAHTFGIEYSTKEFIKFSLVPWALRPYSEQKGGSCSGHAIGQLIYYSKLRAACKTRAECLSGPAETRRPPCPYFIWFLGRCAWISKRLGGTGTGKQCRVDDGSDLSRCLLAVRSFGYVPDGLWRGISSTSTPWKYAPPQSTMNWARTMSNKNFEVHLVPERSFYNVLLAGYAIVVGIKVPATNLAQRSAKWTAGPLAGQDFRFVLPPGDGKIVGYHGMLIVGAVVMKGNDVMYELQNSWGDGWPNAYVRREDFLKMTIDGYGYTIEFRSLKDE